MHKSLEFFQIVLCGRQKEARSTLTAVLFENAALQKTKGQNLFQSVSAKKAKLRKQCGNARSFS